MLKYRHLIAALTAAASLTALPATAHATTFKTLDVTVKPAHSTVREPTRLTLSVHVSACADDVDASAVNETTDTVIWSTQVKTEGKAFTLTYTLGAKLPAGRWVVGDVFGRPCGSVRGLMAFDPAAGYFPSFVVEKEG